MRLLCLITIVTTFTFQGNIVFAASFSVPGEILVKYAPGDYPHTLQGELGKIGWEKIKIGNDVSAGYTLSTAKTDSEIMHVEPNYYGEFLSELSDPSFDKQWYLLNIEAPAAWERSLGEGVVIALVDSGVDLDHEDLADNILEDGWDFGEGDNDPSDEIGHGTLMCGVIAATQNNGLGISGISPESKILPLKINKEGSWEFDAATVAEAIIYASDYGVKIINLSLGFSSEEPQIVKEAIDYAVEKDILVIAAAGQDNRRSVYFPASLPEVVAVSATDDSDSFWLKSNMGPEIELAAPGVNIFTTTRSGGYTALYSGTSFSSAIVTAVASLIAARHPHLTGEQIRNSLTSRADDLNGGGKDDTLGYGRINAHKSLDLLTSVLPGTIFSSTTIPLVYLLAVLGDGTSFTQFSSEVSFESAQITPLGPPLVFLPSLLFQLTLLGNAAEEEVSSITVTTGSDTFSGYNLLSIAPLPWNL